MRVCNQKAEQHAWCCWILLKAQILGGLNRILESMLINIHDAALFPNLEFDMSIFFVRFVLDIYKAEGRPETEEYVYKIPLLVPKVIIKLSLDGLPLSIFHICFTYSLNQNIIKIK